MTKKKNIGKLTTSPQGYSKPGEFIIDDETLKNPNIKDQIFGPIVDGEIKGHGMVPRDYSIYPAEMFDAPTDLQLIPQSEWDARIQEQETMGSSLEHLRNVVQELGGSHFPSLDQNGDGYCWAYSTGGVLMLMRLVANQGYVRLNPHATAAIIKKGRNEGGWCGLSAKWAKENGYADDKHWPGHSRSLSNDTQALRTNMALHKSVEDWVDLARDVYDQNLTFAQLATCLLTNISCAVDFNWWGHSVCAMRLVKVESGSYGIKILNSWSDSWGEKGAGILRGGKEKPDGAIGIRTTTPSVPKAA